MIHLLHLCAARFSGPDAGSFLQSQLSADIGALEQAHSTFAAYCTPRGQVLGLLLVGRHEDSFTVLGAATLLPSIIQRLRMFIIRAQVKIELLDELQVFGEKADQVIESSATVLAPDRLPMVYILAKKGTDSTADLDLWRGTELGHGVVWLNSKTTEKFIPQMLGYEELGAVSFSKGCYPGQEIVARTRYLGKVKRTPLIIEVEGRAELESGSKVQIQYKTEAVDGILIDSACTSAGRTVLFIITRVIEGETPTSISCDGQSYPPQANP